MEQSELWGMLESSTITIKQVQTGIADEFVGPQISIRADLQAAETSYVGGLTMEVALQETRHEPVVFNFGFRANDAPPSVDDMGHWHYQAGPEEHAAQVTELCDQLIRLVVMSTVDGYREHTKKVREAFISFADL